MSEKVVACFQCTNAYLVYVPQNTQQRRLRLDVKQTLMFPQALCAMCGRQGGQPARGAAVNSLGCTGACLHWAARVIPNLPLFHDPLVWGAWISIEPADVASFSRVCSEVNELGYGYLHWDVVNPHGRPGDVVAAHCIAQAHGRYAQFLKYMEKHSMPSLYPHILAFIQTLNLVHQNCLTVPTVIYALHCEDIGLNCLRVQARSLNGRIVSDAVVDPDLALCAWQHVPQPLYRIAEDGNLYTEQEFGQLYRKNASDEWTFAPPCYEHVFDVIKGNGELAHLSALDFLPKEVKFTDGGSTEYR